MIEYRIKLRRVADGRFSPGTRGLRQLRRRAVANSLREMVLRWDNVTAAAEDRQRWRQRVAQCIADVGRIKVKVQFLPARCYASADTGYGPVSVCLSVSVSVTSRCSLEMPGRIVLVLGAGASFEFRRVLHCDMGKFSYGLVG